MLIAMTFATHEIVSQIAEVAFVASLAFVLATLVLFPAITWLRAMLRLGERSALGSNGKSHVVGNSIGKVSGDIDDTTGNATDRESRLPRISVVVACYNEARFIGARIENLLACDYPRERLEIVVASDGSTDATEAIASGFADRGVRVVRTERGGKGQALNAGVAAATGEVLVFTDANTEFHRDALRAIVHPLADAAIGGVAGNQRYVRGGEASLSADGECLHWNWDTRQKLWQSLGGSVTAATGALYAVRRSCFDPVPPHVMDDFHISTGVIARGLRLVFAADAVAVEPVATRDGVEFQRKVRVAVQGLRAVWTRRGLLNPFRHGWYAAQLFAHKVARRLLPVPLIAMAVSAAMLAGESRLHAAVLAAGGGVVGLALVAVAARVAPRWRWPRAKLFAIPHFFCMAQAALLLAWWRVLRGDGLRVWEPERHSAGSSRDSGIRGAHAR
jgi:cellulose synthase/poly-beta-1,6-N-acetylglucosamine synthase-like glycosyltransferase